MGRLGFANSRPESTSKGSEWKNQGGKRPEVGVPRLWQEGLPNPGASQGRGQAWRVRLPPGRQVSLPGLTDFFLFGVLLGVGQDLLLMLPVENLVSMRVGRSLSGYLSIRCTGLGPHRELRLEPNCSSPVLTWISGFLWSFNRGIRPRHVQRDGKPLASRPVKIVSGFLSS